MIANIVTQETGCGSPDCPWIIEVPSGQHINITLTDFALENPRQPGDGFPADTNCRVYATIQEVGVSSRSMTICGGDTRVKHVYTSSTNVVKIRVVGQEVPATRPYFILSYKGDLLFPLLPAGGISVTVQAHSRNKILISVARMSLL